MQKLPEAIIDIISDLATDKKGDFELLHELFDISTMWGSDMKKTQPSKYFSRADDVIAHTKRFAHYKFPFGQIDLRIFGKYDKKTQRIVEKNFWNPVTYWNIHGLHIYEYQVMDCPEIPVELYLTCTTSLNDFIDNYNKSKKNSLYKCLLKCY